MESVTKKKTRDYWAISVCWITLGKKADIPVWINKELHYGNVNDGVCHEKTGSLSKKKDARREMSKNRFPQRTAFSVCCPSGSFPAKRALRAGMIFGALRLATSSRRTENRWLLTADLLWINKELHYGNVNNGVCPKKRRHHCRTLNLYRSCRHYSYWWKRGGVIWFQYRHC